MRPGTVVRAFLLCAAIIGAGLGYVWQKNLIYELGQQRLAKELTLRQLRDATEKLRHLYQGMLLPKALEERARELKLGLGPAQPTQILRLTEPAAEAPTPTEQQFAAGRLPRTAAP